MGLRRLFGRKKSSAGVKTPAYEKKSKFNKSISIYIRKEEENLVDDPTVFCIYLLEEMKRRGTARRVLSGEGSPIKQKVIDLPLHAKIFVRADVRDELLNVDAEDKIQDELSILISKEDKTINHITNQRAAWVEILVDELDIIKDAKQWYAVFKPLPPESSALAEIVEPSPDGSIFKIGPKPRVLLCGSAPDCDVIINRLPLYHARIEVRDVNNDEYEFTIYPVHPEFKIKVKDNITEPKQVEYQKPYRLKRMAKIWLDDEGPFIFREYNKFIPKAQSRLLLEDEESLKELYETKIHYNPQESDTDRKYPRAKIEKEGLEIKVSGMLMYETNVPYRISNAESLAPGEHIHLDDEELISEIRCVQTGEAWIFQDEKRYGCLYNEHGQPVDWLSIPLRTRKKNLAIGGVRMCYQSIPQIEFQSRGIHLPVIGRLMFIDKNSKIRRAQILDKREQIRVGRLNHLPAYRVKLKDYILFEKLASRNHSSFAYDEDVGNFYVENVSKNNVVTVLPEGIPGKAKFVRSGQKYFFPIGIMTQIWIGHTIFEVYDNRTPEFMNIPKISDHFPSGEDEIILEDEPANPKIRAGSPGLTSSGD